MSALQTAEDATGGPWPEVLHVRLEGPLYVAGAPRSARKNNSFARMDDGSDTEAGRFVLIKGQVTE